jgi:hypothetical protein
MSEETKITALKAQMALGMIDAGQLATLDRRTRRQVEQEAMEMARKARIHMMALDATAAIHIHTIHKVGSTLGTAEFLKAMRSGAINSPQLEQLDAALRDRYLEAAMFISANAIRNILADLE